MFRDLQALTDRVYLYPHDTTPNVIQPTIGVVKLARQTLLVDAGNSPRHVDRMRTAMAGMGFAPVETIIYTHYHWDHTFGAATWHAHTIIAHQRAVDHLQAYQKQTWSASALKEAIRKNPRLELGYNALIDAFTDWHDFRIIMPTLTFSQRLTWHADGITLDLWHVGGRHSADSLVVHVREANIVFLGDCYYPLPYSQRETDDLDLDLTMLDTLLDLDAELYIDGHGDPRTHAQFASMIAQERQRQAHAP